ncbi:hypothetical protein SAV31267_067520 [Streptomyces avermitilis]|uniref:Uncharacterized protein n=1 Tax=Streptomyces avermitilis TaxID=33903 RepID=A0A4D4N210_STRAX|nr:hypothetical protein SAV31267_067520 [Streptomyces avermitilis]
MAQGVVAEVVAAVEDAAGHARVLVEPGADGEHGDPGARALRLAEELLGDGGVALAVEAERDPGAGARAVGDLGGLPREGPGGGAETGLLGACGMPGARELPAWDVPVAREADAGCAPAPVAEHPVASAPAAASPAPARSAERRFGAARTTTVALSGSLSG